MFNTEFLDFTAFCGRKESDGLFNYEFIYGWIKEPWIDGALMDDTLSMYLMGGEL